MDFLSEYIVGNFLILVPVLIVIGSLVKEIKRIPNWTIPFILLAAGITAGIFLGASLGMTALDSIFQSVFATGLAVYGNQACKQCKSGIDNFKNKTG